MQNGAIQSVDLRRFLCLGILAAVLLLPAINHAQAVPRDFMIELQRTRCFGTCPAYSVSVDASGSVTYQGTDFVRVTGRATARIPLSQVAALAATVERIGLFRLKDNYDAPITDLQTTYVTVTSNGRTKRIVDYYGAPDSLTQFEDEIDRTTGTARWIRIDRLTLDRMYREGRPPLPAAQRQMLEEALSANELDVVETLLAHGADLRSAPDGPPLLFRATSAAAVRALIEAGVDVNEQMKSHGTALHSAAETQPVEVVAALIKAGADIDLPRAGGGSPLYHAACAGNIGMVKLLLQAGANPATRFADGSALDCARASKKFRESPDYPKFDSWPRYDEDFAGVIALLEAAVAKAKPQF